MIEVHYLKEIFTEVLILYSRLLHHNNLIM